MKAEWHKFNGATGLLMFLGQAFLGAGPLSAAAELDPSKLPPPAAREVDFLRDIRPILDTSCIRCHGPEKPKSGYRLDNRAAALKGGEDGVDILPGNSAKSPFIHYVALLVPDMEMPPKGKGDPLTKEQIGLLRKWIDQGAPWDSATPTNRFDFAISPMVGGVFVKGDANKFREHFWRQDGVDGGVEHFELFEQINPDTRMLVTGHAWRDDYKVTLSLDRSELGFVHAGWEQYRKYYDDFGGIHPPALVFPQRLGQDLHLDIGRAWVDFGLTLPHWPRMVLGYERDYRRGNEAMTSWGSDGTVDRNVMPTSRNVDEGTHILKFDLDAEVKGVTIEDRFRGEFYKLNTHYTNLAARSFVGQDVRNEKSHFQGANSFRLEKKFTEWLFGSGGYFFSKLNANDSFADITIAGDVPYVASVPHIDLSRESHLFNLNGLIGPFEGLTLFADLQSEWTRQEGIGAGDLNGIRFVQPPSGNLDVSPATLLSRYDQRTVSEMAGLRYNHIPFTTIFADARLKQEDIDQSVSDIQSSGSFLENPSYTSRLTEVRVGFNTSPWRNVSFSTQYRRFEDDRTYQTNGPPQPPGGYPGFISARDILTDEVELKLVLRPLAWLKTTLTYQFLTTDHNETTRPAFDPANGTIFSPGGDLLAGRSDSHIYSLGAVLTPWQRLTLSSTFSYQDTRTATATAGLIAPYQGDVYSALVSGSYIFTEATDLAVNYSLSVADYSHDALSNFSPPPVGIRYQQHALQGILSHRMSKNLTTHLQYGYYRYSEPSLAGASNYRVHSIFAILSYRWP